LFTKFIAISNIHGPQRDKFGLVNGNVCGEIRDKMKIPSSSLHLQAFHNIIGNE